MNKDVVNTDTAPKAIGPYEQAIKVNGFLFTSGQIALEPKTGNLIDGGVVEQTRQVFENLKGILEAAGSSLDRVVKASVFLKSMGDFAALNQVYEEFLGKSKPARTTVAISELPKGALVEIDMIALT